jgi:hypothetical protein
MSVVVGAATFIKDKFGYLFLEEALKIGKGGHEKQVFNLLSPTDIYPIDTNYSGVHWKPTTFSLVRAPIDIYSYSGQ